MQQNKMLSYLAVTAGVGCASSAANAALTVMNLGGSALAAGTKVSFRGGYNYPPPVEFQMTQSASWGYLSAAGSAKFYSSAPTAGSFSADWAASYAEGVSAVFPSDVDDAWFWKVGSSTRGSTGVNWVAFRDNQSRFGWLSFTFSTLGSNNGNPVSSMNYFVYDPDASSPANAPTLQAAVAAVNPIPEPTSLGLLALGAMGLATRRQHRKAA